MKDSITIRSRTNYSTQHIRAASFFSRKAYEIEESILGFQDLFNWDLKIEYKSYVTSSVFLSVAFLEAIINEFYSDVADDVVMSLSDHLDPKKISLLKGLWTQDVPRTAAFRVIQKFEIALLICELEPINKSQIQYGDINALIQLRNALIHYEPEWSIIHSDEKFNEKKMIAKLKNKFSLNPFTAEGNAFFPDKCISHGCAEWAVKNVISFVDDFYSKIGIQPPYEISRSKLTTK